MAVSHPNPDAAGLRESGCSKKADSMDHSTVLAAIKARSGAADAKGCILWTGAVNNKGSCEVSVTTDKQRKIIIQRFLWDLKHPDEPLDTLHVCQWTCEITKCVNVEHLRKVPRKKEFDAAAVWTKLQKRGERLPNGCLVAERAYQKVVLQGMIVGIHKAAFMLHHNLAARPPRQNEEGDWMVLRHLCNEARCFEPLHLVYGTQEENCYEDRIAHGTLLRGETGSNATITEELARQIKDSRPTMKRGQAGYKSQTQRAKRFGVSRHIVSDIDCGNSWTHLSGAAGTNIVQRQRAKKSRLRAKARIWTSGMYQVALKRLQSKLVVTTVSTHVDSPCQLWTGFIQSEGYGVISAYGKMMKAHVLACEIKLGRPLEKGQIVRHLCGIKACCAHEHLQPGSLRENVLDSIRHGTHPAATLTEDIVRDIRSTWKKDGLTRAQRAKKFKTSISNLVRIESGQSWKHVT